MTWRPAVRQRQANRICPGSRSDGLVMFCQIPVRSNVWTPSISTRACPAAQQISFNPRPAWTYPDSLMGVISYIRQTLMDAQQHAAAHAIYDKNPAGYKRPDESPSLDALGGVLRRDWPLILQSHTPRLLTQDRIRLGPFPQWQDSGARRIRHL